MQRKISQMRNLGPQMEYMLAEIDINNEDQLRARGAVDAYLHLKFVFDKKISLLALYAMHAALQNRAWQEVSADEKAALQEAIKRSDD